MRAILEFDLPEDRTEFEVASCAMELMVALERVDNVLRSSLKHGGDAVLSMQECRSIIADAVSKHR